MNPRKFLDFFKSKTGKIIIFLVLIGLGCTVYYGFAPPAKTAPPKQEAKSQTGPERQSANFG